MANITHKPKSGAKLTGTEYEAADAHIVALQASDIPTHSHAGEDITSGTVADGRVASTIARDTETAAAITTHEGAADPHTGYLKESDFTGIDFLVGTATAITASEIVVGTTPGGELGGTWASPTVDASHSGSTHAATQAAAEATAAGALSAHVAAGDPHTGYRLESADHTHQSTGLQAGTLDHGLALTGLSDDDHPQYLKEEASGGTAAEVPDHTHVSAAQAGAIKLDALVAPDDVTTLNASTSAHGLMQKYPGGTTTFLRADGSFAAPTASVTFTAFTKDLGVANNAGTFDITGLSGLTADKPVQVMQTAAAISSKGNARDEPEMDQIQVTGYCVDTTTIRCYWNAPSVVVGTYAFAYLVGA